MYSGRMIKMCFMGQRVSSRDLFHTILSIVNFYPGLGSSINIERVGMPTGLLNLNQTCKYLHQCITLQSKKDGKDQETMQSSTIPHVKVTKIR